MNFNLKQLLALAGTGMAGAGIGYGIGNMQGDKEVGEVKNTFNLYNKEENQQIADQAFISGAQYALSQMGGLDKQSSLKVLESFKDELEKISGLQAVKGVAMKAVNKLDDVFLKGIRGVKNFKPQTSQFGPKVDNKLNAMKLNKLKEHASKNKRNLAIAGGGVVAGVTASKMID